MQDLTYYIASTLDGFIAREDGSFNDFLFDEKLFADFFSAIESFGTVLMGRKTYEVGLREGKTSPYPGLEQLVFSRSMEKSPDANVELVQEGALDRIRALKEEDGKGIWLCGGSHLATQCLEAGLIDKLVLKLNPIVFGRGIPLFEGHLDLSAFEFTESQTYPSGVVVLDYQVRSSKPIPTLGDLS